jgi:hypothetical protein
MIAADAAVDFRFGVALAHFAALTFSSSTT